MGKKLSSVAEAGPNGEVAVAAPRGKNVSKRTLDLRRLSIKLSGKSPLIVNRWPEKAIRMIEGKQAGEAQPAKGPKIAEECYRDSLYPHPQGGYGFPAVAFKAAAVDACSHISGFTKVQARGSFHVEGGDLVRIEGEPRMRSDMVRIAMGTADLRHRGEFPEWSCWLDVEYNANVITPDMLTNLFETAGFAIGVGEWRPQRDGGFGRFKVDEIVLHQ